MFSPFWFNLLIGLLGLGWMVYLCYQAFTGEEWQDDESEPLPPLDLMDNVGSEER